MATDNDKPKDEKKKSALATAAARARASNQKNRGGGIREYFKGVRVEMKKVVWPTRKELVSYTWTVLITCFAFGIAFFLADSVFKQLLWLTLGFSF
ncbi:MAG: preprotein translocase subunit SecE [Clostridiales Family XIII bacterium]|nr:preprotein translocase subunit SecE [Clostridiales Family XIII bacterium]